MNTLNTFTKWIIAVFITMIISIIILGINSYIISVDNNKYSKRITELEDSVYKHKQLVTQIRNIQDHMSIFEVSLLESKPASINKKIDKLIKEQNNIKQTVMKLIEAQKEKTKKEKKAEDDIYIDKLAKLALSLF